MSPVNDLLGPRGRAEPGVLELLFEDAVASIVVPNNPEFLRALAAAAPGWAYRVGPTGRPPIASVVAAGDGYELRMDGEEPIRATAVSAACGVIVDILESGLETASGQLSLHCAAVEFAGRLVVFPSRSRAGKSTLVARLAAAGHRLFGDDVLPLSPDDAAGVGTGLAPRLRLPLPDRAHPAFRTFVAAHTAAEDGRYLYLALPDGGLAARHETCALGAIVLLALRPDGPAFLSEVRRSVVLRSLILQNFAQDGPAADILARTHAMMDRLPAFALHYSDIEEAAALLEATFESWPHSAELLPADDPRAWIDALDEPMGELDAQDPPLAVERDRLFRRAAGIELRAVDGETFLARADSGPIHQLNSLGGTIWALLDEPMAVGEIDALLSEAFPQIAPSRIEADVATLFAALLAAGFIEQIRA